MIKRLARASMALVLAGLLGVLLFAVACSGGSQTAEVEVAAPTLQPVVVESTGSASADSPAAVAPVIAEPVVEALAEVASPTALAPASPTPPPTALPAATLVAIDPPPTPEVTPLAEPSPTVQPLPTPPGVYSWTLKVPILMYHYISTPPEGADIYRVDLSVTEAAFAEQMAYLRDNGYTTIDLYDLSLAITNQGELPDKPVLLTFDDGYLDNYQNAFPILAANGQEGTFFVVSEFIDKSREGYMTWDMIKEMAAAGMRIESHSRTHPDLTLLSRDGLIWELRGSQETIAAHIGYTPRYFCYPGGDYNEETIAMLQELDFWGSVTTNGGSWHGFNDRFEWTRIRMRNATTIEEFAKLVDPGDTIGGKVAQQ